MDPSSQTEHERAPTVLWIYGFHGRNTRSNAQQRADNKELTNKGIAGMCQHNKPPLLSVGDGRGLVSLKVIL